MRAHTCAQAPHVCTLSKHHTCVHSRTHTHAHAGSTLKHTGIHCTCSLTQYHTCTCVHTHSSCTHCTHPLAHVHTCHFAAKMWPSPPLAWAGLAELGTLPCAFFMACRPGTTLAAPERTQTSGHHLARHREALGARAGRSSSLGKAQGRAAQQKYSMIHSQNLRFLEFISKVVRVKLTLII